MKIFFVAPVSLDRSHGVSIYATELIKILLKKTDCKIGLLTTSPSKRSLSNSDDLAGCLTVEGPKTYHWNPWFVDSGWLDRIEKGFGRPDLVHFHGIYEPFQSALAVQMSRRGWKYVVSLHGEIQDATQNRKFLKKALGNLFFLNSFLRGSEAVHVLNEAEKFSFQKRFPKVRTFTVPNGVSSDILLMPQSSSKIAISSSIRVPLRIGFIGRIDIDQKGIDLFLNGVKLLQKQHPDLTMKFIFVGYFHTDKDQLVLKDLISSLSDPSIIVLAGPMAGRDKWEMLASFDVFIHTSRYEGMPGSVIEAMAFGKPCLVTPGTNMQEIVSGCEGGWECEASPESIADALFLIVGNRTEIARRGANAKEYVRKHLTWDIIVQSYVQQIRQLLKIGSSY